MAEKNCSRKVRFFKLRMEEAPGTKSTRRRGAYRGLWDPKRGTPEERYQGERVILRGKTTLREQGKDFIK